MGSWLQCNGSAYRSVERFGLESCDSASRYRGSKVGTFPKPEQWLGGWKHWNRRTSDDNSLGWISMDSRLGATREPDVGLHGECERWLGGRPECYGASKPDRSLGWYYVGRSWHNPNSILDVGDPSFCVHGCVARRMDSR